ncbi:MAG: hypothetical protein ACI90V_011886 [Bacillariaceae sp.]|jgi:hypothetical protein
MMVKVKPPNQAQGKLSKHFVILSITILVFGSGLFVLIQNSEVRTYHL